MPSVSPLQALQDAISLLEACGCSVVAVVAEYSPDSAEFHSYINVHPDPEAGVTEDHIVMDSIRELSVEWSNRSHKDKLVWSHIQDTELEQQDS